MARYGAIIRVDDEVVKELKRIQKEIEKVTGQKISLKQASKILIERAKEDESAHNWF